MLTGVTASAVLVTLRKIMESRLDSIVGKIPIVDLEFWFVLQNNAKWSESFFFMICGVVNYA